MEKKYYQADSFIAHGPIKKIEFQHQGSICVLDNLDPVTVSNQCSALYTALEEKLSAQKKTLGFQPTRDKDQFLLIIDLVELFGALTIKDLQELVKVMKVVLDNNRLKQITDQLLRFNLLKFVAGTTKRFFVTPEERLTYLNYSSAPNAPPFDRARFKILKVDPWLKADKLRLKAYKEIHTKSLICVLLKPFFKNTHSAVLRSSR